MSSIPGEAPAPTAAARGAPGVEFTFDEETKNVHEVLRVGHHAERLVGAAILPVC